MSVTDINKVPDVNGKLPAVQNKPVYEQLTISDWMEMKEKLRLELQNVTQSFVRIGYALRKIEDEKMYEADGFKSVSEFAKKEYGLEASTVSRFMAINREYSEGGYSEHLREEYIGYGQSKLSEMLQLPDKDRELITPQTQRSDIRELKDFNRSVPESGEADDIRSLIESYFRENKKDLNDLYGMAENNHVDDGHIVGEDIKAAIELLNPSGNKMYRKGMYMLFFYEEDVKIKKFGEDAVTSSWGDFLEAVDEIFSPAAAGYHTWERYFGDEEKEEEIAPAQIEAEGAEPATEDQEENAQATEESAQRTEENDQENTEEVERETQDQEVAAAGEGPETDLAAAMNQPEGIAPAQKAEPAAADQPKPKHKQGDRILVEGVIDMITASAGKAVNYRIRTKAGKTIWIIEEDIAEECV